MGGGAGCGVRIWACGHARLLLCGKPTVLQYLTMRDAPAAASNTWPPFCYGPFSSSRPCLPSCLPAIKDRIVEALDQLYINGWAGNVFSSAQAARNLIDLATGATLGALHLRCAELG